MEKIFTAHSVEVIRVRVHDVIITGVIFQRYCGHFSRRTPFVDDPRDIRSSVGLNQRRRRRDGAPERPLFMGVVRTYVVLT